MIQADTGQVRRGALACGAAQRRYEINIVLQAVHHAQNLDQSAAFLCGQNFRRSIRDRFDALFQQGLQKERNVGARLYQHHNVRKGIRTLYAFIQKGLAQ